MSVRRIIIQRRITYTLWFALGLFPLILYILLPTPSTLGDFISIMFFILLSVSCILVGLRMLEYAIVDKNYLTVKSIWGVIKKVNWVDVNDCYIQELTFGTNRGSLKEKCIIFELNDNFPFFKTVHNKKNRNCIKVIYSQANIELISKFIEVKNYSTKELLDKHNIQRRAKSRDI